MSWLGQLFGQSKTHTLPDISGIAADMHSHLIPGIDDGAKTMEESIRLIRRLNQLGYKKLITTPHINSRFPNTPAIIREGLEKVKQAVKTEDIPVKMEAAAEYYIEDGFDSILEKGNLMTFGNNNILIEMSYYIPYPFLSNYIYDLQIAGYNIILAHAERYAYYHKNFEEYEKLKARDIMLQVNFMSLNIFNPPSTRRIAKRLIETGLVDFAGTDVHNDMYMNLMLRGMRSKTAGKLIASGTLKNNTLL